LRNQAIAKEITRKATVTVTNRQVMEITIMEMLIITLTGEVIQMINGTTGVMKKAMGMTGTGKRETGIANGEIVMMIVDVTGMILIETGTGKFSTSGCFIMTEINFITFIGAAAQAAFFYLNW
jgi:hypothetical protein